MSGVYWVQVQRKTCSLTLTLAGKTVMITRTKWKLKEILEKFPEIPQEDMPHLWMK
jgi:hypothetical protein